MASPISERRQHALLVEHFLDRFFDSELVSRGSEARTTLLQILALIASVGIVFFFRLINKYGALAHGPAEAANLAALDDQCWFLYFSMVVMGFVTVFEWNALFPDRRDYLILSALPIRSRTLFTAKVKSLILFLLLFSAFVNLLPALLLPLVIAHGSVFYLARYVLGHAVGVLAGNAFVFFSLIAIQGFLMIIFGPGLFRRVSRLVQLLVLISLLTVFLLMPVISFVQLRQSPGMLQIFPPAWFLGLYETVRLGLTPDFGALARQGLRALGLAMIGFTATYALGYRRQVRVTLEGERTGETGCGRVRDFPGLTAQRYLFRSAGERAVFNFILKTLRDSDRHRVVLGTYCGVGIAFAAMGLITIFGRLGVGAVRGLHTELLSIPLVLTFFTLVGMRVAFAFPARPGANWVFRLTEQNQRQPYLAGVRKAMFVVGILPVLSVLAPFYVGAWGWRAAFPHTVLVLILALVLREILIFRLDKIPFTCTYLPGSSNLKVMFFPYLFCFTTYAYTIAAIESRLLLRPLAIGAFILGASLVLGATVAIRNRKISRLGRFVYDMRPLPAAEPLTLIR